MRRLTEIVSEMKLSREKGLRPFPDKEMFQQLWSMIRREIFRLNYPIFTVELCRKLKRKRPLQSVLKLKLLKLSNYDFKKKINVTVDVMCQLFTLDKRRQNKGRQKTTYDRESYTEIRFSRETRTSIK